MIISTKRGNFRGVSCGAYTVYRSIPYAMSPVGERRFLPSQLRERMTDVYDATTFKPKAIQASEEPTTEDCLTLNVWTTHEQELKPVVVWVHGGGFVGGGSNEEQYDGASWVETKEIVFVSVNYRLGVFGFLQADRQLGERYKSSGNAGITDIVTALQWIKENIEAFGGDPNRVTVMGESAGAKCVATLLVVPKARGLFHQVILQSGALQAIRDLETAQTISQNIFEQLNIEEGVYEKILHMSTSTILEAQRRVVKPSGRSLQMFGPVIDGEWIPNDPYTYLCEHGLPVKAILLGTNRDESAIFLQKGSDMEQPDRAVTDDLFGTLSEHVFSTYEKKAKMKPKKEAWEETMTHYLYADATERLADFCRTRIPTYYYRFDWEGPFRASHAQDLPFMWNHPTYKKELYNISNSARPLAQQMHRAWMDFIIQHETLQHDWPMYKEESPKQKIWNTESTVKTKEATFRDEAFPNEAYKRSALILC